MSQESNSYHGQDSARNENQIQQYQQNSRRDNNHNKIVCPRSKNKLKACMKCRLLKTQEQWTAENRCENCPQLNGRMSGNTTTKFQGILSILDPTKSWLRKKLKLSSKIVAGSYAAQLFQQY